MYVVTIKLKVTFIEVRFACFQPLLNVQSWINNPEIILEIYALIYIDIKVTENDFQS